jgi:hypothetical protein
MALIDDGVGASLRGVDVTAGGHVGLCNGEAWSECVDGDGVGGCCRPAKGLGSPSPKGRAHYMRCGGCEG